MQYESLVCPAGDTPSLRGDHQWTFRTPPLARCACDLIPFVIKFQKSTLVHCHCPGAPASTPALVAAYRADGPARSRAAVPAARRSRSRSGVAWGPVRRAGIAGVARAEKRLASGVAPRFRARQTIAHVFGGRRDVTQRPRAVHDPVERLCDLCLSSQVPVAHRPLRYRSRISKLYRLRDQKSAGPGKQ